MTRYYFAILYCSLCICTAFSNCCAASEFDPAEHPPYTTVVVSLDDGTDSLESHLPPVLMPAAVDAAELFEKNKLLISQFAAYNPDSLGALFNYIQFKSFNSKFFEDSFGELGADLIRGDLDLYIFAFDIDKDSAELFAHDKFKAMWSHYENLAQRIVDDLNALMERHGHFVGAYLADVYLLLSVSSPAEKRKFPQFAEAMENVFIKRKPILIATPYATAEAAEKSVVQLHYLEDMIQMSFPVVHEDGSLKWELVFYLKRKSAETLTGFIE